MLKRLIRSQNRIAMLIVAFVVAIFETLTPVAYAADHQLKVTRADAQTTAQTTVGAAAETYYVKAYIDNKGNGPSETAIGTLTFPPGLIQASGAATGSGWSGTPSINQGQGTVSFSLSRNSTATGFTTLFTVSLKPIGAGTAVIGFGGDSRINGTTTTYQSSVITITNPAPPTQSTPPRPSTSVKPSVAPVPIVSPTPTPTPIPDIELPSTPDPTGLITNVQIQSRYNTATITWQIGAANPKGSLKYGSQASTLDKDSQTTLADGVFSTTLQGLEPGVRYFFSITGSGDGTASGTYTGTILTSGFPVTMTISENNTLVKGAQIKIDGRTYTTAATGKATFGLSAGAHEATITTETASQTVDLTVAKKPVPSNGDSPETQTFAYNLTSSPLESGPGSGNTIIAFLGALVGGTVIIAFGFLGFMAYRRRKYESGPGANNLASTVVIDDGYDWRGQQAQQAQPPNGQPTVSPPSAPQMPAHHTNSVYIDDEEPLDMFEQSKQNKQ